MLEGNYTEELCRIGFYDLGPKLKLSQVLTDRLLVEKYGYLSKKSAGFVLRKSKRKTPENSLDIFEYFVLKSYNKTFTKDTDKYQIVYIFENGSIVFWNFTEEEEMEINTAILRKLNREISHFCNEYYYLNLNDYENDQSLFIKDYIKNDLIFLKSYSNEEKMAYSFAFSFSIKLEETEDKLNGIIDSISNESNFEISKLLTNFQKQRHFRRLCTLYLIRTEANFDFKILEEEFYSNIADEFITQYKQMCLYMNIQNSWVIRSRKCRGPIFAFERIVRSNYRGS